MDGTNTNADCKETMQSQEVASQPDIDDVKEHDRSTNDRKSLFKSKRARRTIIVLCALVLAAVAIACTIFFVAIPASEANALEEAKKAVENYDFEAALNYLDNAGDSAEVKSLKNALTIDRDAKNILIEAFSSENIFDDANLGEVEKAAKDIKRSHPQYPDIDTYLNYIEARKAESAKELYKAWQAYAALGDFEDARDRAGALNQQIQTAYEKGLADFEASDWPSAQSEWRNIEGYQDTSEKLKQVQGEMDKDDLMAKLNNTAWMNEYVVGLGSNYIYTISFMTNYEADPTGRTGACVVMLHANNVMYVPVGTYIYKPIDASTINIIGTYNTAGNPPQNDFVADMKLRFMDSATNYGVTESGKFLSMSPNPVDHEFVNKEWKYIGTAVS